MKIQLLLFSTLVCLSASAQDYCCPKKPTVETGGYLGLQDSIVTLTGAIMNFGGKSEMINGFLMGHSPDNLTDTILVNRRKVHLKVTLDNLDLGRTYYYRAFASNHWGNSQGQLFSFHTEYSVWDIDSNQYEARWIGNQIWLTSNLKATRYNNGDTIREVTWRNNWASNQGSWAYYDFSTSYASRGKLYNYHTVSNSNGVCPSGWHVPSKTEWETLVSFLGTDSAGTQLKSTSGWDLYNGSTYYGTDEHRFNAKPTGQLSNFGFSGQLNNHTFYWSSTTQGSSDAYYLQLDSGWDSPIFDKNKRYGFCIRCIKD